MLKLMSDEEKRANGRHRTLEIPAIPSWSSPVRQLIVNVEKSGTRVIGLTSDRSGAGVTTLTRELALAYGSLGKRAIVAGLSRAKIELTAYESPGVEHIDLDAQRTALQAVQSLVLLSEVATELEQRRAKFRAIFETLSPLADVVIVDLPPVSINNAEAPAIFLAAAPECQQVYLICPTGNAAADGLRDCLDICKIAEVRLGGIILNDQNQISTNLSGLTLSI